MDKGVRHGVWTEAKKSPEEPKVGRQTVISAAVLRLGSIVEDVYSQVRELEDAISTVLTPTPPAVEGPKSPTETDVPLAATLEGYVAALVATHERLKSMLVRLEL